MITITNASRQKHRFHYREPGRKQYSYIDIPSGTQAQIGKDFGAGATEDVIDQLNRYGHRPKEEFDKKPDPKFHGLLYSLGKPMTTEQIEEAAGIVIEGAQTTSVREIMKSAAGADQAIYGKEGNRKKGRESTLRIVETDQLGKENPDGFHTEITVSQEADRMVLLS